MEEDLFAEDVIEEDALEEDLLEEKEDEEEASREQNASKETEEAETVVPKKRIIRNPLPKLDHFRLCGPRGIPTLPEIFADTEFKGKGHELEDLNNLMAKYEHWAHRLFPKLPFDGILEKIEKLGSKKPVQVCITKMRLDLAISNKEFVSPENSDEENGGSDADNPPPASGREEGNSEDIFENLVRDYKDNNSSPANVSSTEKIGLTDEQRERIKRNKEMAAKKRKEMMEKKATSAQSDSSQKESNNLLEQSENCATEINDESNLLSPGNLDNDLMDEDMFLAEMNC